MAKSILLYVGMKGTALALDRATGQEVWRTELKGSDFVNVVLDDGELYAATHGELYRLDPRSGAVIWHNTMPGMGWGLIAIGAAGSGQLAPMSEKQRQDQEAASSGAATST